MNKTLNNELLDINNDITLLTAPTGWGKSELVAKEIVNCLKSNTKCTVVLPNILTIEHILSRVRFYLKDTSYYNSLIELNTIYRMYQEFMEEDNAVSYNISNAVIVLTHFNYLSFCGDSLTYYPQLDFLLKRSGMLIIDEVHTFIENITLKLVDIGDLYSRNLVNGGEVWVKHYGKISKDGMQEAINTGEMKILTNCIYTETDMFQHLKLVSLRRVFGASSAIIDIDTHIRESKQFTKIEPDLVESYYKVETFYNNEPKDLQPNDKTTNNPFKKLLDGCETLSISTFTGDDKARDNTGRVILSLYSTKLLKKILNSFNKVFLLTATFTERHRMLLSSICKYEQIDKRDKVNKINNIVFMINREKQTHMYDILDKMQKRQDLNALAFTSMIRDSKKITNRYSNSWELTTEGYILEKQKANDYGTNVIRNVTVMGFESSVAKGTNLKEEIDDMDKVNKGIQVVVFQSFSVTNPIAKYYYLNGKLHSFHKDYDINSMIQAIGRKMRKEKHNSLIYLDKDKDGLSEYIIEALRNNTTSNIIVKDFSLTDFDTIFLDENGEDKEYIEQKKKDVLYRELNDRFQE